MKKPPTPTLNFPRLLNLEKRLCGQTELSVDKIKELEKKLLFSIQELSSSLEKDDLKTNKHDIFFEIQGENILLPKPETLDINQAISIVSNIINPISEMSQSIKQPEIIIEKVKESTIKQESIADESIAKINNAIETMVTEPPKLNESKDKKISIIENKKPSIQKPSVAKRKIEDTTKQACLDEYFIEKQKENITNNENSTGFIQKPKIKIKEKESKSPLSLAISPISPIGKTKESEEYEKELKFLRERLLDKEKETKENERLLSRLNNEKIKYKEIHERFIEDFLSYKNQVQRLLSNYLLECERYKKNEIKTHLSSQRHRLGEFISHRNGSKFEDIWVDGYELRNLKENLSKISNDKEELKKLKKGIKKNSNEESAQFEKLIISQRIKILSNVRVCFKDLFK